VKRKEEERQQCENAIAVLRRAMVNDSYPESLREAARDELHRMEKTLAAMSQAKTAVSP